MRDFLTARDNHTKRGMGENVGAVTAHGIGGNFVIARKHRDLHVYVVVQCFKLVYTQSSCWENLPPWPVHI